MPFFVERFVLGLKIRLSFRYHFSIEAKSLSLEHSFEKSSKSLGAISGELGGCRINSKYSLWGFAIVAIDLWFSALSWWKSTSFSFIWGRFLAISSFKHTNNTICYWWFFLFQGNWWTKYLAHPKIRRSKPCLVIFASLVSLDGFHLLLSTQLTADLTLEWRGGSMFRPLWYI